jgi:hypothetical protein
MNSIQELKETLKLFNEKVGKLDELSFTKYIKTAKTGISISSKRNESGLFDTSFERRGPSQESVEAFLLTFRLFLQNNDRISIGSLAKYYSAGILSIDLETEFQDIRNVLNGYLNDPHKFRYNENGKILTRREMMDMFLYGDLAHLNTSHRDRHQFWTQTELGSEMAFQEFIVIISGVLKAIWWFRDLNNKALEELNRPATS